MEGHIKTSDSVSPYGIPTFEQVWRALDNLIKRVNKLEERMNKCENTPQPVCKTEAVGKNIKVEKKVKK